MHTSCLVLKWQRFVPGKKKKLARKCYFPWQNSNYQSFFIFVASAKYLQCFFSAEWFLLLFLGLQPTSPISGHKRFLLNRN